MKILRRLFFLLIRNEISLKGVIERQNEINNIKEKYPQASINDSNYFVVEDFLNLKLGSGVVIGAFNVIFIMKGAKENSSGLYVGNDTYIGEQNNIRASGGKIIIEKKCLISQQVSLIAADHAVEKDEYIKDQTWISKGDIIIEDDVWIGCGPGYVRCYNW